MLGQNGALKLVTRAIFFPLSSIIFFLSFVRRNRDVTHAIYLHEGVRGGLGSGGGREEGAAIYNFEYFTGNQLEMRGGIERGGVCVRARDFKKLSSKELRFRKDWHFLSPFIAITSIFELFLKRFERHDIWQKSFWTRKNFLLPLTYYYYYYYLQFRDVCVNLMILELYNEFSSSKTAKK